MVFVIIGAFVSAFTGAGYVLQTLKGQVQPNKVTWFLWALAPLTGAFAAFTTGAGWAALPVFMAGFMPLLVFLASFVNKSAAWKVSKFDWLCGVISLLALTIWLLAKDPVLAILLAMLSDFLAALPTLIKIYKYPKTEQTWFYAVGIFTSATSYFVVNQWNFTTLAFPTYLVVICAAFTFLIIFRQRTQNS